MESAISRLVRLKRGSKPDGTEDAQASMDVPLGESRFMRGRVLGAAGVILLGILAFLAYHGSATTRSLTVEASHLEVAAVQRGAFREYIPVTGSLVPARTIFLDAVEGGQVTRVLVEEGQHVEAGQPLLEFKNADLQLRLVEAEARLTEQVNNLNMRRLQVEQTDLQLQERLIGVNGQIVTLVRDLARYEPLLSQGVVSRKTVDDVRDALAAQQGIHKTILETQRINRDLQTSQTAQMQASVDGISGNLNVARENLGSLVMRAPIAGQLTVFEAVVGEAKSRGQRIGQLDAIGLFKVQALVDEFYLARIAVGQEASASVGGVQHALTLTKIYPTVQQGQIQIDMAFAGKQPIDLRRGQTLRAELLMSAESDTLIVANGPWLSDTGGSWAFVLSEGGGSAERRAIRIGRRNPREVEIVGGVREGERLIVSSHAQLGRFERIGIRGRPTATKTPQENGS